MRHLARSLALVLPLLALGCGGSSLADSMGCDPSLPPSRFISCVLWFHPGPDAGWGQKELPEIIDGPPVGGGPGAGSTDVLSLGKGGEIAFGFGGSTIVDGPGPDFLVFENPFIIGYHGPGSDPTDVFKELGVVAVSDDGESWHEFPCKQDGYPYTGCAGWHPVLSNPDNGISPFDPAKAGGDPFDLADLGLTSARYVRIRDVSFYGGAPTAGFDLDAAALIHPGDP